MLLLLVQSPPWIKSTTAATWCSKQMLQYTWHSNIYTQYWVSSHSSTHCSQGYLKSGFIYSLKCLSWQQLRLQNTIKIFIMKYIFNNTFIWPQSTCGNLSLNLGAVPVCWELREGSGWTVLRITAKSVLSGAIWPRSRRKNSVRDV